MNISYDLIKEANAGVNYINVHGKNYAEVAQRVQAFRNLIPDGYITTDILKIENGVVYMKAEAGFYDENGKRVMLATGLAFERQDASNINKTSFIENCETSAVGRALGFIGLGSEKGIASAEEVAHAIETQEAIEKGIIPDPAEIRHDAPAKVTTAPAIPQNPVFKYLNNEKAFMQQRLEITDKDEMRKRFADMRTALIKAKLIENIPPEKLTMEQAQQMIEAMYSNFFSDNKETA